VQEILEKLPQDQFQDPSKTFLDPSCGDGQFLGEIIIKKMENGSTFKQALETTYGVDLMLDNVELCRDRLLCGQEQYRNTVQNNIVNEDALVYDYSFDGTWEETKKGLQKIQKVKEDRDKRIAEKRAITAERCYSNMFE